jgi:hypothetical protein
VSSTDWTVGIAAVAFEFEREELRFFFGGGSDGGGGGGLPTNKAMTGVVEEVFLRVGVGGGAAKGMPLAGEGCSWRPVGSSPDVSSTPDGLTPPGSRVL